MIAKKNYHGRIEHNYYNKRSTAKHRSPFLLHIIMKGDTHESIRQIKDGVIKSTVFL